MSFRTTKAELRTLHTMDEVLADAKQLESHGGTDSEREESERRIRIIKEKILSDELRPFDWAVGYVPSQHISRRVNGQHSSKAFLQLTPEEWNMVRFPVRVLYVEYECETEIDLATLFEQFDPQWGVRNRIANIGAHLAVHPDMREFLSREAADKAVQGLKWYLEHVEGYKRGSAHEQYELLHQNGDYNTFYRLCGYGKLNLNNKLPEMAHKAVVAAMFHATRQGSEEDRHFWQRVSGRTHSMIDEGSHEWKLAAFLENAVRQQYDWPAKQRALFRNSRRPNPIEIFATCLRVFAAYKKGLRLNEAFVAVRDQNAKAAVMKLYPLKDTDEVTA